jgi:6-phosphogluconolactonase
MAVDSTAKFAYVANFNSKNVSAYSIGSNGALTSIAGSPFAAGGGPISVTVDPRAKFAYVANKGSDNASPINALSFATRSLCAGTKSWPNSLKVGPCALSGQRSLNTKN